MAQNFWYPPGSASATSVTSNQGTPNTDANAWPVRITDGTHDATVTPGGALNVAISSGLANPLPVQDSAAETSLASIDSKLTNPLPVSGPLTDAQLRAIPVPVSGTVTGPLTDTQLRASAVPVSLASSPLPSGAATEATLSAFSAKTAAALVPSAFDYISLSYTGDNLTTAVYKTGGAGGSTVATLTLAYSGSTLTSVTKT